MGVERRHVIGAAICALLSWLVLTSALPSLRWIPYAFVAGFLVALLSIAYLLLATSHVGKNVSTRIVPRPVPAFVASTNWEKEKADVVLRSQYVPHKLFESQLRLSKRIDGLLNLITDNFITVWFVNISSKRLFQNEVDRAIRDAIFSIKGRVQDLDLVELVVSRIVPMITLHMQEFYIAERLVRGKNLTRDITESEELDLAIAGKYNDGKLHPAASLAFADTKLMQQSHVRKTIEKILPLVLSEGMLASPAVVALVREIVSCAVLAPILLMLADPDMWNQLLENYGKSILQDRKNVRKLRAALDEHAPVSPRGARNLEVPRLRPQDNERQFERFVRNLRRTPTLAEARRYRSEITSQIRKAADSNNQDALYMRRLEAGKRVLEQRISLLSTNDSARRPNLSTNTSAGSFDSATACSQASLNEILHNASGLSYFMEFMDRRQKMRLVQLWIIVDGFRDPLEEDGEDADITLHEKMTFESPDRMNIKQLRDMYLHLPELRVPAASKESVDAYVEAGRSADLIMYVKARRAILRLQSSVYDEMNEEHLEAFKRSDLFYKWSASESKQSQPAIEPRNGTSPKSPRSPKIEWAQAQRPVGANAPIRKEPELRRAVMSATDLHAKARPTLAAAVGRRSIDDNASRPLFDDDVEDERMTRSVPSLLVGDSDNDSVDQNQESQVVDAMQKELDDIMDEPEKDWIISDSKSQRSGSPRISEDLFGSNDPFVKPSIASLGLVTGSSSRGVFSDDLFGHEEERYLEDEKDDPELKPIEDDIHEAAPGDLGLTEAISVLTHDIDRLVAQEKIVESLTKKAELTNNAAELRILRKSKQSLQREIRRKEMQKQQYVVQESDNSLYGRAAVSIKSIMVGKEEDGHEFAIYVIEVRRQAGDQMPAAIWTITRRYSEFHELHKRLRNRFESVRNLEFPRRQTLFTLQKDFLQRRRQVLERYLRSLLLIPAICRSRELRAFLSQSAIIPTDGSNAAQDPADLVTRIYNSVSDGMDEFLGNLPMLDQLTVAGQNLISAASAQISGSTPATNPSTSSPLAQQQSLSPAAAAEAEAELQSFESQTADQPFVKPISDLFVETFELQKGSAWLRGRAVVLVLHQLLGGTVERKIRETARAATTEAQIVKHLDFLTGTMFPDGKMRQPGEVRTESQKLRSREEGRRVLEGLVPDLAAGVVGRQGANAAGRKIGAVVNNGRLNTHLVMRLFDEIVGIVFPEVVVR